MEQHQKEIMDLLRNYRLTCKFDNRRGGCRNKNCFFKHNNLQHLKNASPQNERSWVQRQMNSGKDPRLIMMEILPKGTLLRRAMDDALLWSFLFNTRNDPKHSQVSHVNTLDAAVNFLKTSKKIIVLTGAGVSVSCGIPDFRSHNGIYARLSKDYPDLPNPEAMFDINYFRRDPRPFFKFAKEIYPGQFEPSPTHRFIRILEEQGRLLRDYTQNIDTLEHVAGIQNVITCHGSFASATCTLCHFKVESSVIKQDVFNQKIPYCPVCPAEVGERGIMKPDIVFFGEDLPDEFYECMKADIQKCDLLIVIGSSLVVQPVSTIPSNIPKHVPKILINRNTLNHLSFDFELLGDCDSVIGELHHRLKSEWTLTLDDNVPFIQLEEARIPLKQSLLPPLGDLAYQNTPLDCSFDSKENTTPNSPGDSVRKDESVQKKRKLKRIKSLKRMMEPSSKRVKMQEDERPKRSVKKLKCTCEGCVN